MKYIEFKTLEEIMEFGYAHTATIEQTIEAAKANGFVVTEQEVEQAWSAIFDRLAQESVWYAEDVAKGLVRHSNKYTNIGMTFDDFTGVS
jgi:hypothetical protein